MAIELKKNSKINLSKSFSTLKKARLELQWDSAKPIDADASAFICKHVGERPKLISDEHFIFYNNKVSPDGAIATLGDQRSGGGDSEVLTVDLDKVTSQAQEVAFIVTIHESKEKNLDFGQLTSGGVTLYNDETGEELASFRFGTGEFTNESMIHMASLYHGDNGWEMEAFGKGAANMDLGDVLGSFS